jgi:hypothetical protein
MDPQAPRSADRQARSVHLLMVHGVGRYDPLSSLLHVYQAFRANLRSPEAPVLFEDRIPDWRLDAVSDDTAPPFLKLVPRFADVAADVASVYIYEVNYSSLAGIVRQNHQLDLTTLFVGFDMAVCASRQKLRHPRPTIDVGDPAQLARLLQRASGLFAAATVPILGVPSILLRNYTETFVAHFTRFFEDVATFVLDKNGEQLISAHLDRTIENIVRSERFVGAGGNLQSELVIAAQSLGSVVVQNHLARNWSNAPNAACVPNRVLTYGSPIGLIAWLWLFLDFPHMTFDPEAPTGTNYFCWSVRNNAGKPAKPLTWLNVVNALDPIATAFPVAAADFTRPVEEVRRSLTGGSVMHRFCGKAMLSTAGVAHTNYLHDRDGFLEMLLRMVELRQDDPLQVECVKPALHWERSKAALARLTVVAWSLSVVSAVAYCALVAWKYDDPRVMWAALAFVVPRATMYFVAFWQRLFFGGPTKRIPDAEIAGMAWTDPASFPYRLRRVVGPWLGARREVDLDAPPRTLAMRALKLLSFAPTIAAMMLPVTLGAVLAGEWPNPFVFVGWHVSAFLLFTAYVILCALTELVAIWRAVLIAIDPGTPESVNR